MGRDDARTGEHSPDLAEIPGRRRVKRALEVAATGGHPIALLGRHPDRDVFARALEGLSPAEGARVVEADKAEIGVRVDAVAAAEQDYRGPHSGPLSLEVERVRQRDFPSSEALSEEAARIIEFARARFASATEDWEARERAIRRVAATIAAMDRKTTIGTDHVAQAVVLQRDLMDAP